MVIQNFLGVAIETLEYKKHQVFTPVRSSLEIPSVEKDLIKKLNLVIQKHNKACDEFKNRTQKSRSRLATNLIESGLDEFLHRLDAKELSETDLLTRRNEVQQLKDKITKLEQEITEHRRPAEELNADLRSYLGHSELSLNTKENGYTLMRSGQTAKSLSEGETTAIALLYFLKSLQDRRFDLANGIVVLDDPVSSLDANALFQAFGFIRARTKDAGQLFVFTHNFTLFRQVRNWFHHLPDQNKKVIKQRKARFYMLSPAISGDVRSGTISWLDPLLEQYESEYQFLFSRVYLASTKGNSGTPLEHNYHFPNMARRLLESFLAFRHPDISGDLWKKLELIPFDEARKFRILRFLHTHSHNDTLGEPEHDLTALAELPAVLKDVLDLIKFSDLNHYQSMSRLIPAEDTRVNNVGVA